MTWSHSPHHGGRADRTGGGGSSADDSRAAITAYGFRTPAVFAPVADANACGVQPMPSAAFTAGVSLARWAPGQLPGLPEGGEELADPAASHRGCGRHRTLGLGGGSLVVLWWIG